MYRLVVFENEKERCMLCADFIHDWNNQNKIFGRDTNRLLNACYKLFHVAINLEKDDKDRLLRVIYGIAKRHHVYITWYGGHKNPCEPDRFLVSGKGHERLAYIQL